MKIRKLFKRAAALALAAVTALSAVPATTAFAAGDIGTISFTHTYDGAGNAMRYNSSANIGGHTAGGTGEYKYRMYVDGETAFCLQPGVPLKTGNTLAKASSNAWNALSAEQRKAVGLALLYGYQGNSGNLSGSDDEKWLATQTLVWEYEERIIGYGNDVEIANQHKPQGEGKFCPMTLKGVTYKEKTDAGEMLLVICKENPLLQPIEIGSYCGFRMEVFYDTVNAHYCLNLCGMRKYKVDLGVDALGNLTRIENEIAKFPARLEAAKTRKEDTIAQLEIAKVEVEKPFAFENELKEKTERLNALNIELNLNEKDNAVIDDEPEQNDEPAEKKSEDRER